jgi:hypothetical protein
MFVNAVHSASIASGPPADHQCIEAAHPVNMAGLLTALPTTQLTRRLAAAGRLPQDFDVAPETEGDQCTGGLNRACRPRADIPRDCCVIETVHARRWPGRSAKPSTRPGGGSSRR